MAQKSFHFSWIWHLFNQVNPTEISFLELDTYTDTDSLDSRFYSKFSEYKVVWKFKGRLF